MENQPPRKEYEDDEIDLFELWEILAKKWRWIVSVTALSAGVSIFVALSITPIYRSEVVMILAEDAGGKGGMASPAAQFGGLTDLAGVNLAGGGAKGEALATLKSRALIEEFIKEKNLMQVLFEEKWDSAGKRWMVEDPRLIPTLGAAHELFSKSVFQVSDDKKTGGITLSVEWKDRMLAAEWANEIVRRANEKMRMRAISEAETSIEYLNKELQKTGVVEIQQAIYRLLEANYKTTSIANARSEYAFKVIDPAVAPDENRRVRPKRSLIVILATLAGGFVSVLGVFVHRGMQNMKQRHAAKCAD
jgi:uncharacterized protein involved in exopolysaccharide biosynthesis